MTEYRFQEWPKIARLNRDCIITEKIDGTNGAIIFSDVNEAFPALPDDMILANNVGIVPSEGNVVCWVQSRTRIISPWNDNHGFARWVYDNIQSLYEDLGIGIHFGEWWGSGIQRGYGLSKGEKYFSLFNTKRWEGVEFKTPHLNHVPVLYKGPFSTTMVNGWVDALREGNSIMVPDYDNPEGVVVYHTASATMYKVTCCRDEEPKNARKRSGES